MGGEIVLLLWLTRGDVNLFNLFYTPEDIYKIRIQEDCFCFTLLAGHGLPRLTFKDDKKSYIAKTH